MPEISIRQHSRNAYLIRLPAEWDAPKFADLPSLLSDPAMLSCGKRFRLPGNATREGVVRTCENPERAEQAFNAALALTRIGATTPRPIALVERRENGRLIEGHVICEYIPGLSDFRRELAYEIHEKRDCESLMKLIEELARTVRKLHDAGILHGNLNNRNIGIVRRTDGSRRLFFLGLDNTRVLPPQTLTNEQRGRDLAALDIPSGIFNEFLVLYGANKACRKAETQARRQASKQALLRLLRHPIRAWEQGDTDKLPALFRLAAIRRRQRKLWVWDERSSQPAPLLASKDRRLLRPARNVISAAFQILSRGFSVHKAFRELSRKSFSESVPFEGTFGIALEENPETMDAQLAYLAELQGERRLPVLLRVYHHKGSEHHERVIRCARELHSRGNPVALALVQSSDALLRPESWEKMLDDVFEATHAFADFYEIGHAVNRGKWGIWDFRDYPRLLTPALKAKQRFPHIRLTGPACIDFDLHSLPALLGKIPKNTFSALSQHLYVDRRGAPENRQGQFDCVAKCALHRAFARVYRCVEEKIIISEVNWPLLNTGPWSPVGLLFPNSGPWESPPSVSEDDYAKFMIRYWLLTIAGGHASRLYWWRLDARGYGLIDDTGTPDQWRTRPAFHSLKQWLSLLSDARFERRLPCDDKGSFILEFSRKNASRFLVKWAPDSMPEVSSPET